MTPALHPDVGSLGFLLGTWRGEGEGSYPTVPRFGYGEEVRFWHSGKPFLAYSQRTWSLADGRPLHAEAGYLRGVGDGRVETVIAHPTGLAELGEGSVDGTSLSIRSGSIPRTPSAKDVSEVRRELRVIGNVLTYLVSMAAVGHPLQDHLTARLERLEED